MQDELNYRVAGLTQHASGSITVDDFEELADATITIGINTLTEGVDFNAETDNETTAENIATAINGVAGFNAEATDNVVSVSVNEPGVAGNEIDLLTSATTGITLSGATLSGGVAATYTDVMEFSGVANPIQVDSVITVSNLSSGGSVVVTPQTSADKENWFDRTGTTIGDNESAELHTTEPLTFWRYKIVLATIAESPSADIKIVGKKSN